MYALDHLILVRFALNRDASSVARQEEREHNTMATSCRTKTQARRLHTAATGRGKVGLNVLTLEGLSLSPGTKTCAVVDQPVSRYRRSGTRRYLRKDLSTHRVRWARNDAQLYSGVKLRTHQLDGF